MLTMTDQSLMIVIDYLKKAPLVLSIPSDGQLATRPLNDRHETTCETEGQRGVFSDPIERTGNKTLRAQVSCGIINGGVAGINESRS